MKITEGELQKSVFKCVFFPPPSYIRRLTRITYSNYADFVVISKEIATLENEMLELKGVLEEWRTVPESLEGGWGDDDLLIGGTLLPLLRSCIPPISTTSSPAQAPAVPIDEPNATPSPTSQRSTNRSSPPSGTASKVRRSFSLTSPAVTSSPKRRRSSSSTRRRTSRSSMCICSC